MPSMTPQRRGQGAQRTGTATWQRSTAYWQGRQHRYGPPGTTDSPQYDANGHPTGRQAGSAARAAERREANERRGR